MSEAGRLFQAAMLRTFKRILAPAGFVKGNRMYVRRAGGQIHAVQFQASTWGSKYFLNLGFSYDFLPGMLAVNQQREIEYEQFDLLDMLMSVRLECLMEYPYPQEWGYAKEAAAVQAEMELNAQNAVGSIGEVGEKWRDPVVLMEAIPPQLLQSDIEESNRRIDLPRETCLALPPLPVAAVVGRDWYLPRISLGYCLTVIAMRLNRRALAKTYLAIAQSESQGIGFDRPLEVIRKKLRQKAGAEP